MQSPDQETIAKPKPLFVKARSGKVHEYQCQALTHDGPCECPLVLAILSPARRPKAMG